MSPQTLESKQVSVLQWKQFTAQLCHVDEMCKTCHDEGIQVTVWLLQLCVFHKRQRSTVTNITQIKYYRIILRDVGEE